MGRLLVGHHFLSVELDRLLQLLVKPLDNVAVLRWRDLKEEAPCLKTLALM